MLLFNRNRPSESVGYKYLSSYSMLCWLLDHLGMLDAHIPCKSWNKNGHESLIWNRNGKQETKQWDESSTGGQPCLSVPLKRRKGLQEQSTSYTQQNSQELKRGLLTCFSKETSKASAPMPYVPFQSCLQVPILPTGLLLGDVFIRDFGRRPK